MGRLAREVRALFQLPRCMHELDPKEALFHAPLAPPSLHWQRFMPPAHICLCLPGHPGNSQGEDHCICPGLTVHHAEENSPPKRDQPCLLVESIVELRREVGLYPSFTDEEVFQAVELPQEERSSLSVPTTPTVDVTGDIDTPEMPPISEAAPKYARWNMVIHPSRPVVATGETPQPTAMPRAKRRTLQLSRTISISPPPKPPKAPLPPISPLPARMLALVRPPTLPRGFAGVVACLKTPELVEVDQGMPAGHIHRDGIKPRPFEH